MAETLAKPCPVVCSAGGEPDSAPTVAAQDLAYQIDGARLLDGVSLSARRGQFIGIIGPNGAGKSTLLRAIGGLLRQREGAVALEGRDLDELSPAAVARVLALVPQMAPYTYGFTALELVLMGRYPHMGRLQVEGEHERRIALDAMRVTETEAFADRVTTTLSGGERQRVFIARALAQQPRILLLDEPTANLDVQHQIKALDLVRALTAEGITALAAIHDLPLAARYCDRLVLLSRGRVLAEGTPVQVLTPANIEAAFDVRAVVYPDPLTGTLTLSLLDHARSGPSPVRGLRVHLVCGGGSGSRLMYELQRAGCTVTAGVLGSGDTDRRAADILGVAYVPVPSFAGIDEAAHAAHLKLAAAADVAMLCETPFGQNNLRNLEALASCPRVVIIQSGPFSRLDYTGGAAQRLFEGLRPLARCASITEAVAAVLAAAQTLAESA